MSARAVAAGAGPRAGALVARWGLRTIALAYLALLLAVPLGLVFHRAFENGFGTAWDAATTPNAIHALELTLIVTAIAVPANTVFGLLAAHALVRRRVPGRTVVGALIDLPLALSPVVVGLALLLTWGKRGWFGPWLGDHGVQVIYALPGMVLATMFVSLPFVVREVVPVLREVGTDQEEAAATLGASGLQTFWRITLPAIRWGLAYGVVLTAARCLGEYGAVAVVSGRVPGRTDTLNLHVEERFRNFDPTGAYVAAVVLALLALAAVLLMNLLAPKEHVRGHQHR
jgi:sulfate/thiosulfate transport system permease protein